MFRVHHSRGLRKTNPGVTGLVSLFLPALLLLFLRQAEASVAITNLAQITPALAAGHPLIADLEFKATVSRCDTNTGVLILQDATDTQLFEVDQLSDDFQSGDIIQVDAKKCLLSPGDFGVFVTTPPMVDNDGVHGPESVHGEGFLAAGRHPLRLDWFNQRLGLALEVSSAFSGSETTLPAVETAGTNWLQAVKAACFHGSWSRLPNFQMLPPVKTGSVSNFDLGFRTRDEMVGIRFEGYFDAPQSGNYRFELTSDDGSRLWIDPAPVSMTKIGNTQVPTPRRVKMAEPMDSLNLHPLVTIEGRATFISRFGRGLKIELRSGQNSVSVNLIHSGSLESKDLLNGYVRVSGVATCVSGADQMIRLGTVAVVNVNDVTIVEPPFYRKKDSEALTTVLQVHSLSREELASQVPVKIRGIVTAVAPLLDRWMTLQDDTRGIFVSLAEVPDCKPNVGEYWNISGYTQPGDFSPIVVVQQAALSGKSIMPEPIRPSWNQLANGSMDVQWVELQGLVAAVHSNNLSLVIAEGHLEVSMADWAESELKSFEQAIVSIRGTLFANWNAETHEVHVANIVIYNGSVMVDAPAPLDPFDAPEKSVGGLLRFDPRAAPFQRVKVRGRVTYAEPKRVFLERGAGIEVLPGTNVTVKVGDEVEAVGYLEIHGATTRLREALLRTTGHGALPPPPLVAEAGLFNNKFEAARISIEGKLGRFHTEGSTLVLQVQMPTQLMLARVRGGGFLQTLRPGSKLRLSGVYVTGADGPNSRNASRMELLVNGPADVRVLSNPPWWTLQRLLFAVAVLAVTLSLAGAWVASLRKQVAQRTRLLQHEIQEREQVERERALEAERSRIARDLHDDLGSRLTEINFLVSASQLPGSTDEPRTTFKAISERARDLVKALDVIVWAVDPEDNSLQSLADYLCGYTREYLAASSIPCRFKVPITCPEMTVDGKVRHAIFMVVKEILNNIVRHAGATEVKLQMTIADALEIDIIDNGRGFDPATGAAGHGLKNCSTRIAKIGGRFQIESLAGRGTTFGIQVPLRFLTVFPTGEPKTPAGQTIHVKSPIES